MSNYSLTVTVPVQSFQQLAHQGYKLCFACGVEREGFKVIAATSYVAPYISFAWSDDYGIAATGSDFTEGAKVQAYTPVDSIRLGQTYTLSSDFQGSVKNGGSQGAIQFNNQADRASPILYRNMGSSKVPFYVGSQDSSQVIQPNHKVAVWFQTHAGDGMMISRIDAPNIEIDMSGRTNATAVYNEDSTWSLQ
ncbi:hypothetical protein FMUND_9554 [Fusarium mundagurra]|uniref:Uncharacterized protein n=1 Tax=Fusarium mundagurra TaxID=1567541 RepID=A0A8H6DCN3_9HYPO|nr:hypothetical protein FMUND_9554 [Fusarium mundagurra]